MFVEPGPEQGRDLVGEANGHVEAARRSGFHRGFDEKNAPTAARASKSALRVR
jgi:hypothetical protein